MGKYDIMHEDIKIGEFNVNSLYQITDIKISGNKDVLRHMPLGVRS